ncbi:hypothetical protein N7G274_005607 [Stereocaulon virgatum]|uniref:F-box domain-containing protein n=1 Tax=Stereocaulon virgatum TaxID=373712 RepID=A0ABR4A9Q9_9LECA
MGTESETTASHGFFDLPRELRDNILGHLFTTSTCSRWNGEHGVLSVTTDLWPSIRLLEPGYIQNLQFSIEAAEAFYRSSHFEIYTGELANFFSYKNHPTDYWEASLSDEQGPLKDFDMKPFVKSVRIKPHGAWRHFPIDDLRGLLDYPQLKNVIFATSRRLWKLGDIAETQKVIRELRKMFGEGFELRQEFEADYGDERADDITWMWETESKEAKSWIKKLGYGPKLYMQRIIAMDWIITEDYGGNRTAFDDDWNSGVLFERQWL